MDNAGLLFMRPARIYRNQWQSMVRLWWVSCTGCVFAVNLHNTPLRLIQAMAMHTALVKSAGWLVGFVAFLQWGGNNGILETRLAT